MLGSGYERHTLSLSRHVALLHAICAMASLYTPIVGDSHIQSTTADMDVAAAGVMNVGIFQQRFSSTKRYFPQRVQDTLLEQASGFGSTHIWWADASIQKGLYAGDRVFQIVQG